MSSLPYACYNGALSMLKRMAEKRVFTQVGSDKAMPLGEKSIAGRYGPGGNKLDSSERAFSLPALTVTYLRLINQVEAGGWKLDQGVIRLLVQLIDSLDEGEDTRAETYFRWMTDIREWFQTNPFTAYDQVIGQIYFVHVTEEMPPEQDRWAIDREMRMFCNVNCYFTARRTRDQETWASP